ncbi:MAG: IPT/TIG domain-containing protein [Armatimonadota bacterium]
MSCIVTLKPSAWPMIIALLVMVWPSYAAGPVINSFAPTAAPVGSDITITGLNLGGTTSVTFNGVLTVFTVKSVTSISAEVPEKAVTGKIKVTTAGGTATSATDFKVTPSVISYTPTKGIAGDMITISGSAFTGATGVKFDGVSTEYTVVDYKTIKARVPVGAETGMITVTTPSGTATSSISFKVLPVIVSFAPSSAAVGTAITITGTSFTGTTAVKFNGINSVFTVDSSTSIRATVHAGAVTGKITVTTGSGTATSETDFSVTPGITSFDPASGQPGTIVTITGSNFTGVTRVAFRGYGGFFTVVSDTSIRAYVSDGATTGKISVYAPSGYGESSTDFTVLPGTTITSFQPTSGRAGQQVVITGTLCNQVTGVDFGGYPGSFTINSDTTVTAVVPENAITGRITLSYNGTSTRSSADFTVLPSISSIEPPKGKVGDTITIHGSGYLGAYEMRINGVAVTNWNRISVQLITAVVPAGATTGKITIKTPSGTATSETDFVVYALTSLAITISPGGGYNGALTGIQQDYAINGPALYTGKLHPDSGGIATINGLEPGVYSLSISGGHWLKRVVDGVVVNGVNSINTSLTNGDADGDNQINLFDFVVIDSKFNTSDLMADLDGDGRVNLFDYVIIDTTFGAQGD